MVLLLVEKKDYVVHLYQGRLAEHGSKYGIHCFMEGCWGMLYAEWKYYKSIQPVR